jgi:hypothetical protein
MARRSTGLRHRHPRRRRARPSRVRSPTSRRRQVRRRPIRHLRSRSRTIRRRRRNLSRERSQRQGVAPRPSGSAPAAMAGTSTNRTERRRSFH